MIPTPNTMQLHRSGCYQVGDYTTYSKLEAVEVSARTKTPLKWYFHDWIYDNIDWTKDPPGDIVSYYGERARQLRDKYDYVVLMFSGGADSTNVLQMFVHHNIFIDEIITITVLDGTPNSTTSEVNAEAVHTAKPMLDLLVKNNPTYAQTKITLLDLGRKVSPLLNSFNGFDYWYQDTNYWYNPWGRLQANIYDLEPRLKNIAETKEVCVVFGCDKPGVKVIDNKFHFEFRDTSVTSVHSSPRHQWRAIKGQNVEFFYWTPDFPQLVVKQAHTVVNYARNVRPEWIDDFFVKSWDGRSDLGELASPNYKYLLTWTRDGQGYHLTDHGLHRLIYPFWNPYQLVTPQAPSIVFGSKDDWLWRSNVENAVPKWYRWGFMWMRQHVKSISPDMWFEYPYERNRRYNGGVKQILKHYPLEK